MTPCAQQVRPAGGVNAKPKGVRNSAVVTIIKPKCASSQLLNS